MNRIGRKIYRVRLEDGERGMLRGILDSGKGPEERRQRGRILLLADEAREGGGRADSDIADVLGAGTATGGRVRRKRVEDGLEAALERKVQANRSKPLLDRDFFKSLHLRHILSCQIRRRP